MDENASSCANTPIEKTTPNSPIFKNTAETTFRVRLLSTPGKYLTGKFTNRGKNIMNGTRITGAYATMYNSRKYEK